ncbi:winged-helix domain-containing protein [Halobaculum litoreum]|uniref:Winged-helix domain-containing protein n=1 Tax=Halobaculum litoreum TaxID=3031998 RepID=A0ABD5XUJ5_9EURY|nr:winged-helix domain-containing protein [Halobaculum sp. DT92]
MSLNDSVVLEFLSEHDLELPPKSVYVNLNRHGHDIGYSTVRLRLNTLEEHGLLRKADSGYYEVSQKGRLWLDDELDASDLEDDGE